MAYNINHMNKALGFTLALLAGLAIGLSHNATAANATALSKNPWHFDRTISREVLENYLSRAITMEGMLHGRGNFEDNLRMLRSIGAKFIGRSVCLWGGEANVGIMQTGQAPPCRMDTAMRMPSAPSGLRTS
jgi:hypothetical protein